MALLAEEQEAGRLRLQPEALFTNSEPLTPALRARLERAFGLRPFNFYATTEGVWGHDCQAGSMHIFDDMCIVENVDEDGVALREGAHGAPARLRARISDRLERLGVPRPTVEVEPVEGLERAPGGKLQMIVPEKRLSRPQR
jgi:hypothetical protein